jgi:SAM-dependent methyltransferase
MGYSSVPPGGFDIGEIDRSFGLINNLYKEVYGLQGTILQAALDFVHHAGQLAILDVGCGTGRALVEGGDMVRKRLGAEVAVTGLGVSLEDYRGRSQKPKVNAAFDESRYDYRVGPAEELDDVPNGAYGVVYSHDGMIYSTQADRWLRCMANAAAPGATLFFNTRPNQWGPRLPLKREVLRLEGEGYKADPRPGFVVDGNTVFSTVYFRIEKP